VHVVVEFKLDLALLQSLKSNSELSEAELESTAVSRVIVDPSIDRKTHSKKHPTTFIALSLFVRTYVT